MPIKIIFVIDYYTNPNAGTEGQVYKLIDNLDRKLFEPNLLVLQTSDWINNVEFPCPVEVLGHSSIKSIKTWFSLYRIAKKYKKNGMSIAHIFFNDSSILCPPIFRWVGIKTIISRRDMGFWYSKFHKIILPLTGKFVHGVLVNSRAVGKVTSQVERISPKMIHTIYNGCSIVEEEHEPVNELITFKADAILLTIVANIRKIKRIYDAIEAISLLSDYNVKLVVIGDGSTDELDKLVSKLSLNNRVLFLGARSDIAACLQHVDIGLLCSESEGFSNAIVEYQFSSLPVICSNVGGNSEAVFDGKNGFLYPMGNVLELVGKIRLLLDSPDLMVKLGDNAKKYANEAYSISTMIKAHVDYYHDILGIKKR
jgi:glycosyltransferase involved in cell wall biosynthesis